MKHRLLFTLAFLVWLQLPLPAQAPPPWSDDLVDHFVGSWKAEGQVLSRDAHHDFHAEWILNHQFLRIHEKTSAGAPDSEHRYEAIWFVGFDTANHRYVMHLMDIFGGLYSETIGYGIRDSNDIRFVFQYPDHPFHTTLRWDPEKVTWEWLIEQEDKSGKRSPFANLKLTRLPTAIDIGVPHGPQRR